MTWTLTLWPIFKASDGWLMRRHAMSVTCNRPSTPPKNRAGHPFVGLEAFFEEGPRFFAPRLLARQLGFAVFVLHPLEEDLDDVADMDLGPGSASGEFL